MNRWKFEQSQKLNYYNNFTQMLEKVKKIK